MSEGLIRKDINGKEVIIVTSSMYVTTVIVGDLYFSIEDEELELMPVYTSATYDSRTECFSFKDMDNEDITEIAVRLARILVEVETMEDFIKSAKELSNVF